MKQDFITIQSSLKLNLFMILVLQLITTLKICNVKDGECPVEKKVEKLFIETETEQIIHLKTVLTVNELKTNLLWVKKLTTKALEKTFQRTYFIINKENIVVKTCIGLYDQISIVKTCTCQEES